MKPRYHQLSQIQTELRTGKLSCLELVDYYLEQIDGSHDLNAYIEVYTDEAKALAAALDQKIQSNPDSLGRCFGLILSVKDNICQAGKLTTAASGILQGYTSPYTATALERLLQEDAIVIGRVNCDQFGMGSSNENSFYGPVCNADATDHTPGGSSGGCAVSVQADTCLLSMGSDTGGSIRQPAGFCGLIGFKPSYGRISRHGLLAYASSFDQIGWIGRSVEDIALMLEVCAGADPFDASMLNIPAPALTIASPDPKSVRIGYLRTALDHPGLDEEIRQAHLDLIGTWRDMGYTCTAFDLKLLDKVVPAYYTLSTAEASANLSRYDGMRYGQRVGAEGLHATYAASRTSGFSTEVKRRILLGTFVLSAGYYDAYYGQAQRIRAMLKDEVERLLQDCDVIFMPVSPVPAWKIGEKQNSATEMYLADIYTVLANLTGQPAISIPLKRYSNGTFFGFQLLGRALSEENLLSLAQALSPRHY